ncbi:hypothetical protein GJ496_006936 [Pomphorhynchus laevis]|nr:hypothetical protein GJ496_006936 [Pomphorhynchus laevis]
MKLYQNGYIEINPNCEKIMTSMDASTSNPKKTKFPVEKDAKKLLSYCYGTNVLKSQNSPQPILNDDQYPSWLWELSCDSGTPDKQEQDPNHIDYWKRKRRLSLERMRIDASFEFPKLKLPKHLENIKPI